MGTDPRLPFGTADFVFNRLLLCGMTDWPGYVRDGFKMVKSGGWVEMQNAMKRCVAAEEGKYQIFRSTIGRKPME